MNDSVLSLKQMQEQLDVFDGEQSRGTHGTLSSSQPSICLLSPPQEPSGRETPVSVDSIPLEWDHTGDVGGSSLDEEEDAAFFSALSGMVMFTVVWQNPVISIGIHVLGILRKSERFHKGFKFSFSFKFCY